MVGTLTRRQFATTAAAAVSFPAVLQAAEPQGNDDAVAFYLVGDTHFLANKDEPAKLDDRSASITSRLVDVLNKLPGAAIPGNAGGGTVLFTAGTYRSFSIRL